VVLLEAAAHDAARPTLLLPHGPGVSAQTAARRATATLAERGLLQVMPDVLARSGVGEVRKLYDLLPGTPWGEDLDVTRLNFAFYLNRSDGLAMKSRVKLRMVRRTALGDEVVERYRRQLESARTPGKLLPIRWS
jgi:hypothetical protein